MAIKKATKKTLIQAIEELFKKERSHTEELFRKERIYTAAEFAKIDSKFDRLEEKINLLPTKDGHFKKMDKVITELQKVREEQVVQSGWKDEIADLDHRVKKIEKHVHISSPTS
ncbi:MAG TPA: hypothetical protein VJL83_01640 [Patescibacteria group bacterium]|nr:hypothetical protein [Patescibacteria group bacterium]